MDDRVKEIYALRRNGELDEALKIAIPLCNQDPDDDNFKALGWVLIDLCKISISNNNLNKAQNYYNTLSKLQFDYEDEFVETLKKQINYFVGNKIYIIKPNQKRFWNLSSAISDATELIGEILKMT